MPKIQAYLLSPVHGALLFSPATSAPRRSRLREGGQNLVHEQLEVVGFREAREDQLAQVDPDRRERVQLLAYGWWIARERWIIALERVARSLQGHRVRSIDIHPHHIG